MKPTVIELVIFKSKSGVSETALKEAAAKVTPILQTMNGYVRREIAVTDDGQWADIVYWTDMKAAQDAAKAAMQIPVCLEFFGLIDEKTMTIFHLNVALPQQ